MASSPMKNSGCSIGPGLRSRLFTILNVALLRLRLQKDCGLALIRNLPFMKGHDLVSYLCEFAFIGGFIFNYYLLTFHFF
jgi:hypothetical protein